MCFPGVGAVAVAMASALTSYVGTGISNQAQNKAAAANYNQQARYAERVNQAALQQQAESDSRARTERARQGESAADRARQLILENRKRLGTARASAGTSGLGGLPLNVIEQNYQALIGGVGTNLQSQYQQLDENLFFNQMDNRLRADSVTNQAIPQKPYFQKTGGWDIANAALTGGLAGLNVLANSRWTNPLTAGGNALSQPYAPPINPDPFYED